MRRWLRLAAASARTVSEWPALWLPGALAWVLTIGWIPFLVAVARPPSVPELTFIGARIVTSGAWPWNAILIAAVAAGAIVAAFGAVASANAVLIGTVERRATSVAEARRMLAISLLAAVPVAVVLVVLLIAAAAIAPAAFNAPEEGAGPLVRMVVRLAPLIAGLAIAVLIGAAFAAVAARTGGVKAGARRLVRLDPAGWTQVLLAAALHVVFLVLVGLLLAVLWAPIGAQLQVGGQIDLASGLLLVGFVAIWLCLVLAGGALHAWSATTWSRLLAADPRPIHP
jgi:hypothetical protein